MLGNVGSATSKSGMVANVGYSRWNRVAISFRSNAVFTSGFVAHNQPRFAFLMSTDVGQCQQ
jgi:hypothetical protein